jgi:hypothetical protein
MSVGAQGRVPLPQVVLFAAIGWLPAVALAAAVVVSLGSPPRPAPPPAAPPAALPNVIAAIAAPERPEPERSAPPRTRTVLARSGAGNWTGPRAAAAPDAPMTVTYRVVCRTGPPFLTLSWDGAGPDYDYLTVTGGLRMSGTGRLDPVSAAGRFEVRTRDDCAWTVRIAQTS